MRVVAKLYASQHALQFLAEKDQVFNVIFNDNNLISEKKFNNNYLNYYESGNIKKAKFDIISQSDGLNIEFESGDEEKDLVYCKFTYGDGKSNYEIVDKDKVEIKTNGNVKTYKKSESMYKKALANALRQTTSFSNKCMSKDIYYTLEELFPKYKNKK